jgi:hypothetical protein
VQFSIWTDMPHMVTLARPLLAAGLVLLAISPLWRPPTQDIRQRAALAVALLVGAELLLGYWFYNYLIWFYPLLIVAVIQPHAGARRRRAPYMSSTRPGTAAKQHRLPRHG